jgi:hypothetical protein
MKGSIIHLQVLGELVEADKVVLVEPVTSKKEAAKATEGG